MFRQFKKSTSAFRRKLCPKMELEELYGTDDIELIKSYANGFVMCWTFVQTAVFLLFLVLFLFSIKNEFMQTEDCCKSTQPLYDNNGLPLNECSSNSCKLYDHVWEGGWDWFDDRPRKPEKGEFSQLFDYKDELYCCNLSRTSDECCDFIPWRMACGVGMWGACIGALCGMLMTQVLLVAIYSLFARRNPLYSLIGIAGGVFARSALFFLIFYIFFGFMFVFLFYWLAMMWCDNPYAWDWWKFGAWYFYYFYDNMVHVLTQGVTEWDGQWDMDTMVGAHIIASTIIDTVFVTFYIIIMRKITNKQGRKLFDLAFFDL